MKSILIFTFILFPLTFALANIIHVPTIDAPTIQQGIDQAMKGDTVLVAEGHYYENIFFRGKEITVASEFIMDGDTSHISKTIIDGSQHVNPDSGSVVYFINGETLRSILFGFTITGGTGSYSNIAYDIPTGYMGGGIEVMEAGGRIEYNRIINNIINPVNNDNLYGFGAGIDATNIDSVIIRQNEISNNSIITGWSGGAAIDITQAVYLLFEQNIVEENVCTSSLYLGSFAAIDIFWIADPVISFNIIRGNKSVSLDVSPSGTNHGWGGGIYVQGCSPKIYNNIIVDNSVINGRGGGITLDEHNYNLLEAVVINNTIINNTANIGGGMWIHAPGSGDKIPILFNNIVWGNTAEINPGIKLEGPIHLYNSLIQDPVFNNINTGVFCADSLFADTTGHLGELSPCIGRGVTSLDINGTIYEAPAIDFDGNPRPSAVDPMIDLGVYESDYAVIAFPLSFHLSSTHITAVSGTMHCTSEISNYYHQDIQVLTKIYNSDSSFQDSVEMFYDGEHGDGPAGDGLYAADYQTSIEDIFSTGVAIQNNDKNIRFEYPDKQKFTTIGPLVYKGYTIVTLGDSHIDPGETHRLKLQIQNSGQQATAAKITAKITPLDTLATMVNNIFQFNDIPAGQTVLSTNYRSIRFSKYFPGPIDTVRFAIDISSDGYTFWRDSTFNVVVGVESEQPTVSFTYSLKQNYPNPFNPNTTIEFTLLKSEWVILKVFNVLGQQVATLVNEKLNAGTHTAFWNAASLPSGVYLYRLQAGDYTETKKLILLK